MTMILQGTKMATINNKGLWLKKKVQVLRKVCTALKDVLCLYAYVMFICICIFSTFRSGMLCYKVFHQNYNYITMSGRKIRSLYKLFLLCKFSLLNSLHFVLESNFWWFEWITARKSYVQQEQATVIRAFTRSFNWSLPFKQIVTF